MPGKFQKRRNKGRTRSKSRWSAQKFSARCPNCGLEHQIVRDIDKCPPPRCYRCGGILEKVSKAPLPTRKRIRKKRIDTE